MADRLAADTRYVMRRTRWLVHERGIEPHARVREERLRSWLSRTDLTYDHATDSYTRAASGSGSSCRDATEARPPADDAYKYRARKTDCDVCGLRVRCHTGDAGKKLTRSIHEGACDLARDLSLTDAYLTSARVQDGRDAARTPEAHPEAGWPAPARPNGA